MSELGIKSKAIVLGMLFKVDVANPNAGWTEETVTPLKKIETPDNQRYPYVSGQALRRYLRDTLAEIVEKDENGSPTYRFSPEEPGPDPKSPILTAGKPDLYIDDDLFGFMRAVKGGTRRRESPLRVSAAFGLFPYKGDRDLGTRSALRVTNDPEKGGAIFETEITNNIFRTTWLLELDRVGFWHGYEHTDTSQTDLSKTEILELDERRKRVKALLQGIKYLNGGARQARLLIEFVPQFVVYARMTKKLPLFLNTLNVAANDGQYNLNKTPLIEVIKDYAQDIQSLIIGLREGFITAKREDLLTDITSVF
ncbi:MAG: type I-B CRISPR-associated protein Cas7/Cst2/DevR, partial [Ignavibacteria bacterium]